MFILKEKYRNDQKDSLLRENGEDFTHLWFDFGKMEMIQAIVYPSLPSTSLSGNKIMITWSTLENHLV